MNLHDEDNRWLKNGAVAIRLDAFGDNREYKRLGNDELLGLYSPNIRVIKLRWAGHIARMGGRRFAYRFGEGKRPIYTLLYTGSYNTHNITPVEYYPRERDLVIHTELVSYVSSCKTAPKYPHVRENCKHGIITI
jgi:hypothetical protein